jgi:hypothetical protein
VKKSFLIFGAAPALILMLGAGCSTEPSYTSSNYQPGPVVGHAVGYTTGAVVGNVAASGVASVEGLAAGVAAPFDTTTHVVRRWRTETTADGRTIQVPVDILVDAQGRPVSVH